MVIGEVEGGKEDDGGGKEEGGRSRDERG